MDLQQLVLPSDATLRESPENTIAACGARAIARLIECSRDCHVCLPPHTTVEIIEHPVIVAVPGAAYYTCGLLAWQGHHLPVLDIDTLLRAHAEAHDPVPPRYALVVAYQRAPNDRLEYGAIALSRLPQTIEVGDESWCDLPTTSDIWPLLSLSCFLHGSHVVPIVDTAKLFLPYHG